MPEETSDDPYAATRTCWQVGARTWYQACMHVAKITSKLKPQCTDKRHGAVNVQHKRERQRGKVHCKLFFGEQQNST